MSLKDFEQSVSEQDVKMRTLINQRKFRAKKSDEYIQDYERVVREGLSSSDRESVIQKIGFYIYAGALTEAGNIKAVDQLNNFSEFFNKIEPLLKEHPALLADYQKIRLEYSKFRQHRPKGSISDKTRYIQNLATTYPNLSAKQLMKHADSSIIGDMKEPRFANIVSEARKPKR